MREDIPAYPVTKDCKLRLPPLTRTRVSPPAKMNPPPPAKRVRTAGASAEPGGVRHPISTGNGGVADVDLSLLEAVERSQQVVEALDLKTLKKLVLSFERRLSANLEARLKYPDQPDKFADSELDLHDELQKLKVLAGGPELYPDLVALNAVPSILGLLTHDNVDVAIDVVSLLQVSSTLRLNVMY